MRALPWCGVACSTEGEVGEHEEHAENAGVDQVEPGEGNGAATAGGRSVHGGWVLEGCSSSMARIFNDVTRSGCVIAQVAAWGEQVAGGPVKGR